MNPTTIPVTITPDAAARVAELGMQRELQQMLEHALASIPGLRSLNVVLALPYDTGDETRITIDAIMDKPEPFPDPAESAWTDWIIQTFPPEVLSMIGLMTHYRVAS